MMRVITLFLLINIVRGRTLETESTELFKDLLKTLQTLEKDIEEAVEKKLGLDEEKLERIANKILKIAKERDPIEDDEEEEDYYYSEGEEEDDYYGEEEEDEYYYYYFEDIHKNQDLEKIPRRR